MRMSGIATTFGLCGVAMALPGFILPLFGYSAGNLVIEGLLMMVVSLLMGIHEQLEGR